MRRFSVLWALFLSLCLGPLAGRAGELRSYDPPLDAPSLALSDLKGRARGLSDYGGRVVLVNFWATWCPPCVEEMPAIARLQQRFAARPFSVLAVNVGEPQKRVAAFVKRAGVGLEVLLDSDSSAFEAWDARLFPTSYLLDSSMRVRYRVLGPIDWEGDEAVAAVEALLAEIREE